MFRGSLPLVEMTVFWGLRKNLRAFAFIERVFTLTDLSR